MKKHIELRARDSISKLEKVAKKANDGALKLRLKAIILRKLGKTPHEIAERLMITDRSVTNWILKYNEGGLASLVTKPSGRPLGNPKWDASYFTKLSQEIDALRHERNTLSADINAAKKAKKDPAVLLQRAKDLPEKIADSEEALKILAERIDEKLLKLPNMLHPDVPQGADATHNVVRKFWGKIPKISFPLMNHVELTEGLDIAEVSAVIFYEPIPSAIRKIQRTGRTARLSPGKLFILMTKDTRDIAYHYASTAREKKMYKTIEDVREEINNRKKEVTLGDFKETEKLGNKEWENL